MQGRGVVTMEQGVQEGPAVPADRRWPAGGAQWGQVLPTPAPPPACPAPAPPPRLPPPPLPWLHPPSSPTSGRWDSHTRGLWGGSPSHTASSSVAGSPWALGQNRSAGGGGERERGRGVNQVCPCLASPLLRPRPPESLPTSASAPGLTAVRVGKTQSNISHPRATQTTRSVA